MNYYFTLCNNVTYCWNCRYISSEGTQSSSRRSSRLHSGGDSDSYNKTDEESCVMKTDEEDNELYDRDPQVRRVIFLWMARVFHFVARYVFFGWRLFSIGWQDTICFPLSGKMCFLSHLVARDGLFLIEWQGMIGFYLVERYDWFSSGMTWFFSFGGKTWLVSRWGGRAWWMF